MTACGCPCGMCAQGHCDKCWGRGPHVMPAPCSFCPNPDTRDRLHTVITPSGADLVCGLCVVQLLASRHLTVTVMLEPVPVVTA